MIFSDNSFIKKRGLLLLLSKWRRILNAYLSILLNNALNKRGWILFRSILLIIVVVTGSLFYIAKYLPQQSAKAASWYSSSWLYRKAIAIDSTKVSGPSDLSNFPVLISLSSDSDIASHALSSGNDILFTSSDGVTKLNHEIEKYTSGTGELVAWVKVPTLTTYSDTVLYIYYGNSGSADQQNATAVWDSNYKWVYHMNQTPTGSTGDIKDSTGTNDATSVSMLSGNLSTGKVGNGLSFDGGSNYLNTNYTTNNTAYTFEFWLNASTDGGGGYGRVFDKKQAGADSINMLWDNWPSSGGSQIEFGRSYSTTAGAWYVPGQIGFGNLKHVVVTYVDGVNNDPVFYINGVQTSTVEASTPSGTAVNNTDNYIIGNRGGQDRGWDGLIDEARFSNVVRSGDWITTSYNNESSPSTFYSLGIQQTYGTVLLSQSSYRFLTNADSITPGAGLVAANTLYYASSATETFRLRMNIQVDASNISSSGQSFKLQYVERGLGTCSSPSGTSPSSYTDITSSTEIAYNNNGSITDGANIASTANDPPDGSRTIRYQTYEEGNNFTNSQNAIASGESGQWDFSLKLNNITTSKVYCIRAVKSDGTPLDTYSYYPQVARIITPASAWYSNSWLYRKKITIPYTQITGGANLTNFPVLISLTNTDLKNNALSNGNDILFTSSDNATKLDHEIESYDPTTGTLVAWVRIPTLSYTTNTDIYMYFGNPLASNQQNRTGVWNSNYKLVMHMNENPNSTADGACGGSTKELCDSTSNANDGDSNGTTLSRVTGQVGGALYLGGSDEYISLPASSSLNYSTYSGLSLTMWVKPQTLPSGSNVTIMSSWSGTTTQRPFHVRMNSANTRFRCQTNNGNGSRNSISNYAADTWFQLGCVLTLGTKLQAEVNGSLEASDSTVEASIDTNTLGTVIGNLRTGASAFSQYYNGLIDEIRIYDGVLSTGWLDAEYKNQNSPSTFTTFAATQDQNLTPVLGQGSYRFFANGNSTSVGTALAAQDTDVTVSGTSAFRLRANVTVDSTSYSTSGLTLKLQYANKGTGTCSSPQYSYADITNSTTIAFNDNATPVDGSDLTSNANDPTESGRILRKQTYEELNNFTNSTAAIGDGEAAMWDFSLKDNGGPVGATFCFRIVQSTGSLFNTYTYYPQVTIHPFVQSNYSIASGAVSSRSVSFASTVTTGNLIVVLVNTWSSSGIQTATVTDNKGNTYSTAISQGVDHGGGNVDWSGIFYVTNANGGSSFTVTATPTSPPQQISISIHEYSGLNALDQTTVNYGSGTSGSPGNLTPITSPELYFGGIDFNSGSSGDTTTLPAGYSLRTDYPDTANNPSNISYDAVLTSTGAVNPTATFSTSQAWISAGVTFYYATDPVYTQQSYRFFSNTNSTDVGSALAVNNAPVSTNSTSTAFRLRTLMRVDVIGVSTNGITLKLQFALKGNGTCSSPDNAYSDVTTSTAIAYNDNALSSDGSGLTSNASDPTDSSRTIRNQTYEELNNFTNSQASIAAGEDGMWDFSLKPNGVTLGQTYCFRMVKSDGTELNSYTNYPTYVFDILIQGGTVESLINAHVSEQITFSSPVTSGNAIILFVHTRFRSVSPSVNVTDNKGNTYSLAVSRLATNFNGSNPDVVMIFYSLNVTGGSGLTIDISSSDNSTAIYISAFAGEYANIVSFDQSNSNRATASSATPGSITTTYSNELIFLGFANDSGNSTTPPAGYNERFDVTEYTGHISGAVSDNFLDSTGTINPSATLSGSSDFIAAIASFQIASTGSLEAKFVDSGGAEILSPSLTFSTTAASIDCQTVSATLGTSNQKLRITNTTGSPSWSLSIAALSGETSQWSNGTDSYDYNDSTGSGCTDGADADTNAGQLSINPGSGTSSPQSGCTNTGVTLGSSSAFVQGTTSSIGLISASGSAGTGCYWDVTGIDLSQTIPPTKSGTYSLNLSITLVAT